MPSCGAFAGFVFRQSVGGLDSEQTLGVICCHGTRVVRAGRETDAIDINSRWDTR